MQAKEREIAECVQLYNKAKGLEEMVKLAKRQQQSDSPDMESEMKKAVEKLQIVWTDVKSSFKASLLTSAQMVCGKSLQCMGHFIIT